MKQRKIPKKGVDQLPKVKRKVAKKTFEIVAENIFKGRVIGETIANNEKSVIGRNLEISVADITGDYKHENYRLWFKILRVDGSQAYSTFIKEALRRDYVRSIVRRRTSRVDCLTKAITKDGHELNYFTIAITTRRVRKSKESAIRRIINEKMSEIIPTLTIDELVISSIFREPINIEKKLRKEANKIAPIQIIEPLKIQVTSFPKEVLEGETVESGTTGSREGEET